MTQETREFYFPIPHLVVIFMATFSCCGNLCADGMRNPPTGAEAISMIGGKYASVDDLTAITINPANLTGVTNLSAEGCLTFGYQKTKVTSPSGDTAESRAPWAALPAVYAAWPVKDVPCVLGIGIDVPFGRSSSWRRPDTASIFQYQLPYYTQLQTLNINPTVAFKLSDDVSVGLGIDIMRAEIKEHMLYPWGGDPNGDLRIDGSGYGYGANAGLTWDLTPNQRLSLTFRSPMVVDLDGSTTLNPVFSGFTPRSDFSTKIPFPAVAAIGYRIGLTDTVHVEMDAEWIGSSTLKQFNLDLGNNSALLPYSTLPQNWHNNYTVGMGADWQFAQEWTLRGGWLYLASPVPDSTFAPNMVDADQAVLSTGLQYKHGPHTLELAFATGLFFGGRRITGNPKYDGKYDFQCQLGSVSYEYAF